MRVYIGSDHGGFTQKQFLLTQLAEQGFDMRDKGTDSPSNPDDYPDYAVPVAKAVQEDPDSRGILLCRSGEGMEIVANKFKGIRAALVWRPDISTETRHDNDSNIVVISSDFVADHDALLIAQQFLTTPFSGEERHLRRIDKITALENGEL